MPDYLVGSAQTYTTEQAAINAIAALGDLTGTGIHRILVDSGFTLTSMDFTAITSTAVGQVVVESPGLAVLNLSSEISLTGNITIKNCIGGAASSFTGTALFKDSNSSGNVIESCSLTNANNRNIHAVEGSANYRTNTVRDCSIHGFSGDYKYGISSINRVERVTVANGYRGVFNCDTVIDTVSISNTAYDFNSNTNVSYSASSDATATGTGSIESIVPATEFVDAANGDFTLTGSSQLIAAGSSGGNIGYDQTQPNVAPVFDTAVPDLTVMASTAGSYDLSIHPTDANGDALTYAISPALPSGLTLNSSTGVISWDGTQVVTASALFTLTVDDGNGGTANDSFLVEITPPTLNVTNISSASPIEETQIVIDFEHAAGALSAGDFNVASQTATQATIDIPNLRAFVLTGQTYPTLNYLTDITIPVTDGSTTFNVTVQVQPKAADQFGQIESMPEGSTYLQYVAGGLVVGDYVHASNANNITFDIATGLGTSDSSGGSIDLTYYNGGEWGAVGTFEVPPFPAQLVTIDSITPNKTGANVVFSYPAADVTGYEYRVDDGAWASASSPLAISGLASETAYTLYVRPLLDGAPGEETSAGFTTDPAVDSSISPFQFTAQSDVALSTEVISNAITILGVDAGVDIPVTVTSGEYSVSTDGGVTWGAWTSTGTNVRLNYQIRVRHTTSSAHSTLTSTVLNAGGESGTFSSTTLADVIAPVITLNVESPYEVTQGDAWADPQATVTDNVDATRQINSSQVVDTSNVGTTVIDYDAVDAAGNVAATVQLTVNVVAPTPPTSFSYTNSDQDLVVDRFGRAQTLTYDWGEIWTAAPEEGGEVVYRFSNFNVVDGRFSLSSTLVELDTTYLFIARNTGNLPDSYIRAEVQFS